MPILALFTGVTTAHAILTEGSENKEENLCDVTKTTRVPPNLEAVLKTMTKSEGNLVVAAKRELTVRTCLAVAGGIIKVLPDNSFHVVVTSLTKKIVTVLSHSGSARLTEPPIVIINMLHDTHTKPGQN